MVSDIQIYWAFIVKNTRSPVIAIHDVGMKALPLPVECKTKKPKYLKIIKKQHCDENKSNKTPY